MLTEVMIDSEECNTDGSYDISVLVSPENTDFDLFVNGDFQGFYTSDSTSILIDSIMGTGIDKDTITICQNDIDTCCFTTIINNPCLCGFANMTGEIIDCNEMDSTFSIILDFEPQNNGSGFTVGGNGSTYGSFSYADIPITLGPISTDLQNIEFIFFDNDDVLCFDFIEIGTVDCELINACNITDVVATANDCNSDGTFNVDITFEVVNPGAQGFTIQGNGTNYGTFPYGESLYTLEGINGDCETIYEFIIIDIENNDCSEETGFIEVICCDIEPCAFSDLTIEQGCEPFSGYVIDFNVSGNSSELFDLFIDQMYLGTFAYADLPIISDFGNPVFDDEIVDVLVTDSDNPGCTISLSQVDIGCEELCTLTNLLVELHPCDDGTFFIDFEFDANFTGGTSFNLQGNGNLYGTYEYGETFYTAGPFTGDCETIYEFVIVDTNAPDCQSNTIELLEPVCCDECNISNVSIDLIECNSEELQFILNFDFTGTSNTLFDVFSREGLFGTFTLADLPLTISGFPNTGNQFEFINICINDNDDCCQEFEWDLGECFDEMLCDIDNINIEMIDCNSEEMSFVLDFDFENTSNASFDVFSRDGLFNSYNFVDLPITIADFPNTGNQFEFIRVCENDNADCCEELEWDLGDCYEVEECSITITNIEFLECTFNNIWWIISAEATNAGSTFSVLSGGNTYGPFNYADSPITLQMPLQANNDQYNFTVIDNDLMDCQSQQNTTFLEVDCVTSSEEILDNDSYTFINHKLYIDSKITVTKLTVYNVIGQRVDYSYNTNDISLEKLSHGIYLVAINYSNKQKVIKVFR